MHQSRLVSQAAPETQPVKNGESSGPGAGAAKLLPGINVAGFFRAELGLGEAARRLVNAVEHSGVPYSTLTYTGITANRQDHPFESALSEPIYDTNLICINADILTHFAQDIGPDFFRGRYSIGFWFWEVSQFLKEMHEALDFVNEIWVASDYVAGAIAQETGKPVFALPLPVEIPNVELLSRADLGLPDDFLFFFAFDFWSTLERKNPLGLVEAFKRAFRAGEGPMLLIKSINGDKRLPELERLRAALADRSDIRVVDEYVSAREKESLMATCDCYVSLHRSEGFGLTMAEAMAYGKPVIATAYSGNLTFMTEANSYLVPYKITRVPPGCEPYPVGAKWADPDIEAAASLMRHVYEDRAEARERGAKGCEDILTRHDPARAAEFVASRFEEIQRIRAARPVELELPASLFVSSRPTLERAEERVSRGIGAPLSAGSRRGRAKALVRRILLRALWPQLADQHEINVAVIEALQRVEHATDPLHWTPYTSDPTLLRTTDAQGRPAIGYRRGRIPRRDEQGVYHGFEEIFRGSEARIRDRQRVYLDVIGDRRPVLDVGCGRGEFLDLLREAGVPASGIDIDPGMVARCREKAHAVEQVDANEYLSGQPDDSLGVVFSAQVIEHLAYEHLLEFLRLAREKLVPGGLLVAETVNPHFLAAFKTFWVDPTHRSPIFPEVVAALCGLTGFESAVILFPHGVGGLDADRREQSEYAVMATK